MNSDHLTSLPPNLELTLRPATDEDLPAIITLDQMCLGGLWTMDGYKREVDSPNSDLLILQNNQDQGIIGLACSWAILEEAHITILAIHPQYRQQGLGRTMLYALFATAVKRRLERATLEVRASNQAAITLYEQFGLKEAGRRRRYYQDSGEDALILWRSGLQHPTMSQTLTQWHQEIKERLSQQSILLCLQIDIDATDFPKLKPDLKAGCCPP